MVENFCKVNDNHNVRRGRLNRAGMVAQEIVCARLLRWWSFWWSSRSSAS